MSAELEIICSIKCDYETRINPILNKLGSLCIENTNEGITTFESSISIQCNIFSAVTLECPCPKSHGILQTYMRPKSESERREIYNTFMQWMEFHKHFSSVLLLSLIHI